MIRHDGIRTHINGENRSDLFDAINEPLATVLETLTCELVFTAKKGTSNTSGDNMVIGRFLNTNLLIP